MAVKKFTREHWFPSDFIETKRDDALGIQVLSSSNGLRVMGFSGRSQKPDFFIKFASIERAEAHTSSWETRLRSRKAAQQAEKAIRNAPHSLKVSDVLSSSWGYDQTNVDFYQVVELVGKRTVVLREVAKMAVDSGQRSMQGQCVPMAGQFTGEPFRKHADAYNRVRISSFQTASPLEFKEVCGARIYRPSHYSTYA